MAHKLDDLDLDAVHGGISLPMLENGSGIFGRINPESAFNNFSLGSLFSGGGSGHSSLSTFPGHLAQRGAQIASGSNSLSNGISSGFNSLSNGFNSLVDRGLSSITGSTQRGPSFGEFAPRGGNNGFGAFGEDPLFRGSNENAFPPFDPPSGTPPINPEDGNFGFGEGSIGGGGGTGSAPRFTQPVGEGNESNFAGLGNLEGPGNNGFPPAQDFGTDSELNGGSSFPPAQDFGTDQDFGGGGGGGGNDFPPAQDFGTDQDFGGVDAAGDGFGDIGGF